MAIRSPQQLRKRLRQNALDCDELAGKQLRPANRTRMLRTAEQYRILADNIDRLRWGPLIKSLEIARESWLKPDRKVNRLGLNQRRPERNFELSSSPGSPIGPVETASPVTVCPHNPQPPGLGGIPAIPVSKFDPLNDFTPGFQQLPPKKADQPRKQQVQYEYR
jgi:hypothetical protein